MILACVILTQSQRVTDGRTDVRSSTLRTDILTVANIGLCIANYMLSCWRPVKSTQSNSGLNFYMMQKPSWGHFTPKSHMRDNYKIRSPCNIHIFMAYC